MSAAKAFIDTNIFIYIYSGTETQKRNDAMRTINLYDRVISTQVLNEFCNVCLKKIGIPKPMVEESLKKMSSLCELVNVYESTVFKALEIHAKYRYAYYDSLMIASALETGCNYLISEDMADSQIIEGILIIKNIF